MFATQEVMLAEAAAEAAVIAVEEAKIEFALDRQAGTPVRHQRQGEQHVRT